MTRHREIRRRGALAAVFVVLLTAPGLAREDGAVRLARVEPRFEPAPILQDLPQPLSRADVVRYKRIFALQEQGRMREADRLIRQLNNRLLLGHVLAERYLGPHWRSRYGELRRWLQNYADHPQARRIYRLALKRRPAGAPKPPKPVPGYLGGSGQSFEDVTLADVLAGERIRRAADRRWLRQLARDVARGRLKAARRHLARPPKGASALVEDVGRWLVARGELTAGHDARAFETVARAARRSGEVLPAIHWIAGLAAWRTGRYAEAARFFAAEASHPEIRGEPAARAAFWAARAFLVSGRPEAAARMLHRAASVSDEFYGLIAKTVLGREIRFGWDAVGGAADVVSLLLRFPGSRRALALAQVGRLDLAEAEIRKLAARAGPRLLAALAALAERLQLPAAQLRVAERLKLVDGRSHHGALYPPLAIAPEGGYVIDRALIWAIVRAESGFDARARSPRGALGLMQIRPTTARSVARRFEIAYRGRRALLNPTTNLTIGQAYLQELLDHPLAGRSLVHLALAYNAGLARLERWDRELLARFGRDPLLYLESVPVRESRLYVKKVLTNLWAYRIRLGQPTPSLEALAENRWPVYVDLEPDPERDHARTDR